MTITVDQEMFHLLAEFYSEVQNYKRLNMKLNILSISGFEELQTIHLEIWNCIGG